MNTLFQALSIFILGSCIAEALEPGFYSAFDDEGEKAYEVWNEEKRADHRIAYLIDGTVDIGIGEIREGVHYTKSFLLNELEHYFEHQKHKGFVSVTFHKAAPSHKSLDDAIVELEEFFFSRGYRRILFLGARGSGVQVYKDITKGKQGLPSTPDKCLDLTE